MRVESSPLPYWTPGGLARSSSNLHQSSQWRRKNPAIAAPARGGLSTSSTSETYRRRIRHP